MASNKCPVLVDGQECALALVLVEQDIDRETEVYECASGHRKYVLLGESEKKSCLAVVSGTSCGLALSVIDRDPEAATEVYECPLGHRTYKPLQPQVIDDPC